MAPRIPLIITNNWFIFPILVLVHKYFHSFFFFIKTELSLRKNERIYWRLKKKAHKKGINIFIVNSLTVPSVQILYATSLLADCLYIGCKSFRLNISHFFYKYIYEGEGKRERERSHKCKRIVSTWIVDFQTSTGKYDPRLVMAWLSRSKATAWTSHKLLHWDALFTISAV